MLAIMGTSSYRDIKNEHTSRVSHFNSKPVASSRAWSTMRRPCFTRSYLGDAIAWIRRTGCLFPTRARERTSCGSHRDKILLSMGRSCHFPSTTSVRANDFMPAILSWVCARHIRPTHLLLPRRSARRTTHLLLLPGAYIRCKDRTSHFRTNGVLQRLGSLGERGIVRFKTERSTLALANERSAAGVVLEWLSHCPTIMGPRTRQAASGAGSVRFIGTRIHLSNR